jgi:hypothetical protein
MFQDFVFHLECVIQKHIKGFDAEMSVASATLNFLIPLQIRVVPALM